MAARAHVLIVDDDPIVGKTFARMLSVSGYEVEVVDTVDAAIAAASRRIPGAILSDLRMPLTDGMGLLARVRRDPRLREVPIAIVTGDHFLSEDFLGELRAYGAAVRFKPLFLSDLLGLVEGLLASGAPSHP